MLVLGFALAWGGYDVMTWGYVLIRGWNIKFLTWSNPIHPYQWPPQGQDPPKIPQGRLWPGGQGATTTAQTVEQQVTGGTP